MGFEPQKLFIGVMDFFTILLPGALLTFILKDSAGGVVLGRSGSSLADAQGWAAFLFVSYLLGHLIFLVSSWFDDAYDWFRSSTLDAQIAMLAKRDRLPPLLMRKAVWLIFKHDRNVPMMQATRLRHAFFKDFGADGAINTFQWSKIYLGLKNSPSLAIIQRLEADSKFFRSFALVMFLILLFWCKQEIWPRSGFPVVVVLLLLAIWRYMEQRFKAIRQAYWSVIAHAASDRTLKLETAQPRAGSATHAGGIVVRKSNDALEFLLVAAKENPGKWTLPIVAIEPNEPLREAAIRGVHQQAGVWAVIGAMRWPRYEPSTPAEASARRQRMRDAELGEVSVSIDGRTVLARFVLMQAIGNGWKADKRWRHQWFSPQNAIEMAGRGDTGDLLLAAEARFDSIRLAAALANVSTANCA